MRRADASRICISHCVRQIQCADAMRRCTYVRTDELTHEESGYDERERAAESNARDNGQIYLVHWPQAQFTKVGFSVDDRRWRPYLRRGGELLGVIEPASRSATVIESEWHAILVRAGLPRFFGSKAAAAPFLGHNGAGWTECYVDRSRREVLRILIDRLDAARRGA